MVNTRIATRVFATGDRVVLDDVDLVELTERTLESRGWTDTVELRAPESVSARVDSRRIDIVVANLVGNALRHGAPPVRVELSVESGFSVITVVDHGPGISPEDRQAIFRRFYKVDTARGRSEKVTTGGQTIAEGIAVKAIGELLPDGTLVTSSEYLKNGKWEPGHSAVYREDPKAEVVFK